ncbi:hypothetical protein LSAT2_021387 [Lamellibrachia satsuma]|nr:hypothetical protein LSAT2_021387 [Lamellibrachia satsuma]
MNKVFVCVLVLALEAVISVRAERPEPCTNRPAGYMEASYPPYYFICKGAGQEWDMGRCQNDEYFDEPFQRCMK